MWYSKLMAIQKTYNSKKLIKYVDPVFNLYLSTVYPLFEQKTIFYEAAFVIKN